MTKEEKQERESEYKTRKIEELTSDNAELRRQLTEIKTRVTDSIKWLKDDNIHIHDEIHKFARERQIMLRAGDLDFINNGCRSWVDDILEKEQDVLKAENRTLKDRISALEIDQSQFEELEKQLAIYKRALEIQIGNQMQTQRLLSPTAADISYIIKCRIQQAEKELEEQDNA